MTATALELPIETQTAANYMYTYTSNERTVEPFVGFQGSGIAAVRGEG